MLKEKKAPTFRLPLYHREHSEQARVRACSETLASLSPDIVHAVCGAPWTTVVPREVVLDRGLPLVFTEQFVAPGFTFEPELYRRIQKLYRESGKVIAVSRNNRDLLTNEYGFSGDIVVIPNPAPDNPVFDFSDDERKGFLEGLGLPLKKYQAVTVARCADQKGLDVLIEGVALLPQFVRDQIHFAIVGDGPDKNALIELSEKRGTKESIRFLGWQTGIPRLLCAFDLFVLPSRWEGQPFALAEALSVKRPVIASAVSGIPEMLDGGKNGDLVDGESPEDLARAIRSFVENPAILRKKADRGYRYVRRYHDAEQNLSRTVQLWDVCLSRP
jgi:glycosyltransferase involved in cell wall biosynthesis